MKNLKTGTNFPNIDPKQLIRFSQDYNDQLPALENFVKMNMGKNVRIPIVRAQRDGSYKMKIITGRLCKKTKNSFTLQTHEDFSGAIYEEPVDKVVRFDNVLGEIPLYPYASEINPFDVDKKTFETYFEDLEKMRDVLSKCIGTTHATTIVYQLGVDDGAGYCQIECEVLEVNKSNFMYKNCRTVVKTPTEAGYRTVDLIPNIYTECFVTQLKYLKEVSVDFETTHKINMCCD